MELTMTLHEASDEPTVAIIGLSGSVTVRDGEELKNALAGAFVAADKVLLDVGGITETDSSFFQLLCSARLTAEQGGRELALAPDRSAAYAEAAHASGFIDDGLLAAGSNTSLRKE